MNTNPFAVCRAAYRETQTCASLPSPFPTLPFLDRLANLWSVQLCVSQNARRLAAKRRGDDERATAEETHLPRRRPGPGPIRTEHRRHVALPAQDAHAAGPGRLRRLRGPVQPRL